MVSSTSVPDSDKGRTLAWFINEGLKLDFKKDFLHRRRDDGVREGEFSLRTHVNNKCIFLTDGLFCVLFCAKLFASSSLVIFTVTLWNLETQAKVSQPENREAGALALESPALR